MGGWGHAEPLLPVARLAERCGHRVSFAGQAAVVPRLQALGFETFVVGPDTLITDAQPLVPVDRDQERAVMRDHFVARYGASRAAELTALAQRHRPDLVVCDEIDVGAVVAAERLGVPCVTVTVIAAGRLAAPDVVGDEWRRLRLDHGLPDDPETARIGGTLAIAPVPRSFRDPAVPTPPSLRWTRPPILDEVRVPRRPAPPFVYATLGTVFNLESGDLLARLLDALGRTGFDALLTTGPHVGSELRARAAPTVRVEEFVPQHEVLGRCAAVVCHGGSGTLIAALSLGVPVVVLPLGADQPDNADRCEALGVGVVLDPMSADPVTIADAVETVVRNERFARAAAALAAEAAGQPAPAAIGELRTLLDRR